VNKHILAPIVLIALLCSLPTFVHAQQTFTIPPLSSQSINLNLKQGDTVNGTISVTGGTGTGVDFMVDDPNGNELLSYNYTTYTNFEFSAPANGTYTLNFNNSFCSCVGGKNVTLNYSINDQTAKITQQNKTNAEPPAATEILILIAAILSTAAVAILSNPKKTKQKNNQKTMHMQICQATTQISTTKEVLSFVARRT